MDTEKLEVEDSKPQLTFSPIDFISHLTQPILSMQFNKYSQSIWWCARPWAYAATGTKVSKRYSDPCQPTVKKREQAKSKSELYPSAYLRHDLSLTCSSLSRTYISSELRTSTEYPEHITLCVPFFLYDVLGRQFWNQKYCFRGAWVARWVSICLQLRSSPWGPGIESHIEFPTGSLLLPLPMSQLLCLPPMKK